MLKNNKIINFYKIEQNEYLNILSYNFVNFDNDYAVIIIYEKDEEGNNLKKFVKVPISQYNKQEALYYKIEFEMKSKIIISQINAYFEIGYDYPFK